MNVRIIQNRKNFITLTNFLRSRKFLCFKLRGLQASQTKQLMTVNLSDQSPKIYFFYLNTDVHMYINMMLYLPIR